MPFKPKVHRPPHAQAAADAARKQADRRRGTATQRGYDSRWNEFSRLYRQLNPLCVECGRNGRVVSADCVDHVVPLVDAPERKYDLDNLEALCSPCHARKTAKEDGGWGHKRKAK